jgi:hypothetical protein
MLLDAVSQPGPGSVEALEWLEKGDWLALAQKVGAEKVFFVHNDPVVVFRDFADEPNEEDLIKAFRRAWCMARPQHLFISRPGILEVYSLNQSPPRKVEDWQPIDVARTIPEVTKKLNIYRREQIETGHFLADKRFGDVDDRADKRLIEDLKTVRKALFDANLKNRRYAHALIGRSIFVRYLEDRGILTPAYFQERVARENPVWQAILAEEPEKPDLMLDLGKRRYDRILRDKAFTYALFDQLANDFNGDMFPRDKEEEAAVSQDHLNLLRGFLLGESSSQQLRLFFWAYDFEIVPIELISSIYEEFYHKANEDDKGTHYTPSVLVDYVLSQVLSSKRLATNPRILDPACGSGTFLVEAFRRIVRYHVQQQGYAPSSDKLRTILCDQITGVEINEEAVHVAAFSLYLALLHYQEPPDILAQICPSDNSEKPLPHLIYSEESSSDTRHYNSLFHADTFGLMQEERDRLGQKLKSATRFAGRSKVTSLYSSPAVLPLAPESFDIIVGNPPWGFKKRAVQEIELAQQQAQRWCEVFGWSIGDKELSQAFIARSLTLLKEGGESALLVSTGVFLKHHPNSRKFRRRWLQETTINAIVNFTHVRQIYFNAAIAPFTFVSYGAKPADSQHRIHYWSAKKTDVVDKARTVVLTLPDLHQIKQTDLMNNEALWKVYWWGSHRDAALISALNMNERLDHLIMERGWVKGRGFQGLYSGSEKYPSDWLKRYKELPTNQFHRYGSIKEDELVTVPGEVARFGTRELYSGWRLLIKRGITEAKGTNGRIESRLDDKAYCFRNSVHAIKVDNAEAWERKVLLGILWSSLARYYFFMTASSWGTWHHEIHLEEILNLPIRFPDNQALTARIVRIVDKLKSKEPATNRLFEAGVRKGPATEADLAKLERQLDAAVFELYELSEAEQDLICDLCTSGLDLFYNSTKNAAIRNVDHYPKCTRGLAENLHGQRVRQKGLEGYLNAFLQTWNRELEPDGKFFWRVIWPPKTPMIAVVFTTHEKGKPLPDISTTDDEEWARVLERCAKTLSQPVSRNVYVDGMIRAVSDTEIIVIKRNERRLWTRSLAREDAEATFLQAIRLQEITDGGDR